MDSSKEKRYDELLEELDYVKSSVRRYGSFSGDYDQLVAAAIIVASQNLPSESEINTQALAKRITSEYINE